MSLLPSARRLVRSFLLLLLSFFTLSAASHATIQYSVSLEHPEQHLFHVTMTIPDVKGEVTVQMAAWNALYQIRDFGAHMQQVSASAGNEPAAIEKMDKQTWRIQGNGTVTIHYATYWDEVGPFGTQLNAEHAFINPAMILLYIPGRRGESASFSTSEMPSDWRIESAARMLCVHVGPSSGCAIESPSYDALADGPIEIGKFQEFDLSGVSPRITVVVHGEKWRKKQIEQELKRICEYEIKLMEGAPFDHYTFILHIGRGAGGGGMEHSNSTAIGVPSDEYLSGVAAHEFFHLWNVKRIRPATLEPVDYTKEQYTRALWFAEGVTSTYGSYTLVRSGIWNKDRFYEDLGEQITELESRPANRWQSAEQSSLDAWLEKYPLYNQPDDSVSYYTKGQVLGDLLDILIRDRTNNAKSLDDVLRAMNKDFAKQGKFYRDSLDVRLEAEKVAGGSFEEFFQKYVAGIEPFPYQQILGLAGLEMRTKEERRATLGFAGEREASGAFIVRAVDSDGLAAQAGVRVGDAILTWNGGEVPRRPSRWVMEQSPGDLLTLRIRREDKELSLEFRLGEIKEIAYEVMEDSHATDRARRIREGLLRGETSAAAHH
ncbi:MAG TPA: PDZ domain-containing protein [Candidatus Acidoferrum sp.]|nr:PDZ domain-containing protein [Candidatus Acidoferrum sp.]